MPKVLVANCLLSIVCEDSWKIVDLAHEQEFGGAGGVRTRDLLDAIEARSQLRYGPTGDETECLSL